MTTTPCGIYCPIITPLDVEERLDEPALRAQLDRLAGRVDGLMLLGTTGELPVLSPTVADRLVDVVLDETGGSVPTMLGVGGAGRAPTRHNLTRVRRGVDHVSVCSPYYFPVPADSMLRYFLDVAESSPVPVMLYNIPQNTHQVIPLEVVEQLAAHENVCGIKDSSGDVAYLRTLIGLAGPVFSVLQGTDELHAEAYLRMGVDGYVSGLENVVPGAIRALAQAIARDDADGIARTREHIAGAVRLTSHGFWLSALKTAVGLVVGGGGTCAAPLPPSSPVEVEAIRADLLDLGLLSEAA